MGTDAYRAEVTDDDTGVEICAPMKNVYAIALGLADGLEQCHGEPFHNLKSAVFAQAVRELGLLCRMAGGRAETAVGLAGAGDLEVTGLSGRNKVYGARIGRGEPAKTALDEMVAAGQTVEGVAAARFAAELAEQRALDGLPLLGAITEVLAGAEEPAARITAAVLPARR
jgi:glycerol-3-phosphate dehydrogenase (NAD(P)+)